MLIIGPMFEFLDFGIWISDLSFGLWISELRFLFWTWDFTNNILGYFLHIWIYLSIENSLSRLKPKSGFLTQSKKG